MPRQVKLSELLLGFEGLALLRGLVDGSDVEMEARVREITKIAASLYSDPYSRRLAVPELDPRSGYALWSSTYDQIRNPLILVEQPVVEVITGALPPGRALDAACGTGRHTLHLAQRHAVTGVDASPDMLALARAKVPEARFLVGDLRALPFCDASYNLVVCGLSLCHVADLTGAAAELARVARPGARLVLTDPHPIAGSILSQAFFPTDDGGLAFVRNHPHRLGQYLDAFAGAGLRLRRCHEPPWIQVYSAGFAQRYIPEALSQALAGIPFAIVWELEKA